jgi:hypothetical protein
MEQSIEQSGRAMKDLSPEQLEDEWQRAKFRHQPE